MHTRNYANTATYFERRARKAANLSRREHLMSIANLYLAKARESGQCAMPQKEPGLSRRERLAAMFRAYNDFGQSLERSESASN